MDTLLVQCVLLDAGFANPRSRSMEPIANVASDLPRVP
jgi:hypothetical protein